MVFSSLQAAMREGFIYHDRTSEGILVMRSYFRHGRRVRALALVRQEEAL